MYSLNYKFMDRSIVRLEEIEHLSLSPFSLLSISPEGFGISGLLSDGLRAV